MSFQSPPIINRNYTLAFSDQPHNTLLSRIFPLTVFRQTWRLQITIRRYIFFGPRRTITLARATLKINIDRVRADFLTGNPSNPANIQVVADASVEFGIINILAGIRVSVDLYLDPSLQFITLTPRFIDFHIQLNLWGVNIVQFTHRHHLSQYSMTHQINIRPYVLQMPQINRSLTFTAANARIRTVSGHMIVEGDVRIT